MISDERVTSIALEFFPHDEEWVVTVSLEYMETVVSFAEFDDACRCLEELTDLANKRDDLIREFHAALEEWKK